MTEKTLGIIEKGKYKNIDAYSLNNGEYFVCVKNFAEARKINMPAVGDKKAYDFYSANVNYNGTTVGFIIKKEEEAKAFNACGGVGDSIKISLTKEIYTDKKGVDRVRKTLNFAKV